ncbi:hypothetical protein AgCh_023499 [Apium graveolens]
MYPSSKMSYLPTLLLIIISTFLITTRAANILVRNNCPTSYGLLPPLQLNRGGHRLNPNDQWSVNTPPGTARAELSAILMVLAVKPEIVVGLSVQDPPLLLLIIISTFLITTRVANILVRNNCPTSYGLLPPLQLDRGGHRLNPNDQWSVNTLPGTARAELSAILMVLAVKPEIVLDRGGRRLNPNDQWSVNTPPGTARAELSAILMVLAVKPEIVVGLSVQVDGFNIPMEFGLVNNSGGKCQARRCIADINGQCPANSTSPCRRV